MKKIEALAHVRAPVRDDVSAIARIAEAAGLFPADMLPDMIVDHFGGSDEQVWLVVEHAGAVQGFAFAEPEPLTDRTWNLRAIGIDPMRRRFGLATTLLNGVEAALRERTVRLLIIETTDGDDQRAARAFYPRRDYSDEARIRNFWEDGVAKLVFAKALLPPDC